MRHPGSRGKVEVLWYVLYIGGMYEHDINTLGL